MNSLPLRMIFISFLVLFALACEEIVWDNPYDANTALDPSEWTPKNLQAQVLSDSQIKLTWIQDKKPIRGFRIERQKDGGSWTLIAEIVEGVTQYIDTGLTYGSNYIYRVYAYTASIQSDYATSDTTSTSFSAPTNLTATPQYDTKILLEWTDNSSFEEGFRIERQENGGTWIQITDLGVNMTQYTDTGLSYGPTYTYRVYAYTPNNQSGYAISNTTSTDFPCLTNFTATEQNDTDILLEWVDNCDFEEGFRIERQENGGTWIQITDLGVNMTQYTDTGLSYGPTYTYRVYAYTSSYQSSYIVSNSTKTSFPAPTNLEATSQNDTEIMLEWVDNCGFEEGFLIVRMEDNSSWTQIGEVAADITQFTDAGVMGGINYNYQICAFTTNNVYCSNIATSGIPGQVSDIDGNIYKTVYIGNQWWMAENLRVTHYRNGDVIPNETDSTEWNSITYGAFCNYDNDVNYAHIYGNLFNWYAVNDSRNVAPEGWHVPSDLEWQNLVDFLGGSTVAGGKMKEVGNEHWNSLNTGATNISGFTGLPGGNRDYYSKFLSLGYGAYYWSSSLRVSYYAWFWYLRYDTPEIFQDSKHKQNGFSVRCVRD